MNLQVKRAYIFLTLIILIVAFTVYPVDCYAAAKAEGYEIKEYNLDIQVNKDHSYIVNETLSVNLPANFSTLRTILPSGNYSLTELNVEGYDFQTKSSGGNRELVIPSIGEEKETSKVIRMSYKIREYNDNNDANDLFYYDALSPNWQEPISKLSITLHLPSDFDWSDLQYYAGQYGSQDVSDRLNLKVSGNDITVTGEKIPSNFGITFKAELPDGYWEDALDNSWAKNFSVLLAGITFLVILLLWVAGGRDPKFPRKPERHPIEGLSPADVGYLLYGKMRIKDIIALIVYLAIKGNLRIVEYQPKKYKFVKLDEPKNEERYIRNVYNTLFENVYDGRAIEMEDLGSRLIAIRNNVESSIASGYSSKDMRACTTFSKILRVVSIIILAASICVISILSEVYVCKEIALQLPVILGVATVVVLCVINWAFDNRFELEDTVFRFAMIVSGGAFIAIAGHVAYAMSDATASPVIGILILVLSVASMVVTLFMKSRAYGNAKLASRLYGLRHFMSRATPGDLAPLNKENPDYYYELVPYALLFSMAETWARKFKWIKAKSPFFYEEEMEGVALAMPSSKKSTDAIARDIKTFSRTIESEYHAMLRKRR